MATSAMNRRGLPNWIHGFACGGTLVTILMLVWASQELDGQTAWSQWTESGELRRPAYAERVYVDDLLRTRANTWSNFAYVLVGLACHDLGQKSISSVYLVKTPALSLAFGAACCYLGFGSGLFHASLTRFGQQLDVAAMYSPLLTMIAISVGSWLPKFRIGHQSQIPTWPALVLIVVVASWLLFRYKWSMSSMEVLFTLITTVGLLAFLDQLYRRSDWRWLIGSGVALVLAIACRQLDVAGRFSSPDAWLQGHALWHILTSLSLACMYFYFRSVAFETWLANHQVPTSRSTAS